MLYGLNVEGGPCPKCPFDAWRVKEELGHISVRNGGRCAAGTPI